ncbi:putative molybdopterin-guanine dinucleotide biosynthesis protein [Pseudonocardia sp. N23]|nr:putative molybdopterin-guanine dinucleotide biosynthesis protein [Pseudonocardia sp. N23]
MSEWVTAVRRELGLEDAVDADALVDRILDLTADVAHGVSRPAAPVTAYLLGLAAGRAADLTVTTNDFAGVVSRLAEGWDADSERGVAADEQAERG